MSTLKELNEHKEIFKQEKKAIKVLKEMTGSKTTDSILKQLKKEHKKTKKIIKQLENSMTYQIYNDNLIIYLDLLHKSCEFKQGFYHNFYDLDIDIIEYMNFNSDVYLEVYWRDDDSYYGLNCDIYFKDVYNNEILFNIDRREIFYSTESNSHYIILTENEKYGEEE